MPFGVFEPTGEGAGALLRGELAMVGGCLVVKPETGTTYAVWWPSTASWDKSAQALTVNGTTYRLGDKVEVGGGEIEGEPPAGGPDACKSYKVFMATSPSK